MKTVQINIYKFNELSNEIQASLIEKEKECGGMELCHMFSEDLKFELDNIFNDWDLIPQYSLNYSQGDGLSFYSRDNIYLDELLSNLSKIDIDNENSYLSKNFTCNLDELSKLQQEIKKVNDSLDIDIANESTVDIQSHSRYVHEKSCTISINDNYDYYDNDMFINIMKKIELFLNNWYVETCIKLRDVGYDVLYPTNESIKNNIINNDYDYFENGDVY